MWGKILIDVTSRRSEVSNAAVAANRCGELELSISGCRRVCREVQVDHWSRCPVLLQDLVEKVAEVGFAELAANVESNGGGGPSAEIPQKQQAPVNMKEAKTEMLPGVVQQQVC
jgi:hypothetical protein